ncbi:MAG: ATP-binding protein [Dissulfuribacterales bacterium]
MNNTSAATASQRICAAVTPANSLSRIRTKARTLFNSLHIQKQPITELLTIINELGGNILRHAGRGEICVEVITQAGRLGFRIVATDSGPGIADIKKASQPGFSEDNGLGLGLSGITNLSDKVQVDNLLPHGTRVEVIKWLSP